MENQHLSTSIRIKNPIIQHVSGVSGAFRLQNVEKQRTYTLPEWRSLCLRSEHQPPAPRGSRRSIKQTPELDEKEVDYTKFDDSEFTTDRCGELEKAYWKTITYNSPLYGADMLGSLFTDDFEHWNVAHLDNLLNTLPEDIPGVNTAYLYFGMWKSTFAWHLEDMDLCSINYIHFGAPKQWYSISQSDHDKFYSVMREIWPEEHKTCHEFLRHKTFNASPSFLKHHGINVNKLVHYQQEFVITFPYGYHAGFNYGYNCAESVNFAFDSWIDIGLKAEQCRCISDSVGINVAKLIASQMTDDEEEEEDDGYADLPDIVMHTPESLKGGLHGSAIIDIPTPPHSSSSTSHDTHTLRHNECVLCPNTGPFSLIYSKDHSIAAHRVCALYIPETYSEIDTTLENSTEEYLVGIQDIPAERWRLRCTYCTQSKVRNSIYIGANSSGKPVMSPTGLGACVQCAHPTCNRAFHPTCIDVSGSEVIPYVTKVPRQDQQGEDEVAGLKFFCRFHRDKRTAFEAEADADLALPQNPALEPAVIDVEVSPCYSVGPASEYGRLVNEWAGTLLPGDVVQLKSRGDTPGARTKSSVFGAIVQENSFSGQSVLVIMLDHRRTAKTDADVVEIRWRDLVCPYPRMLLGKEGGVEDDLVSKRRRTVRLRDGVTKVMKREKRPGFPREQEVLSSVCTTNVGEDKSDRGASTTLISLDVAGHMGPPSLVKSSVLSQPLPVTSATTPPATPHLDTSPNPVIAPADAQPRKRGRPCKTASKGSSAASSPVGASDALLFAASAEQGGGKGAVQYQWHNTTANDHQTQLQVKPVGGPAPVTASPVAGVEFSPAPVQQAVFSHVPPQLPQQQQQSAQQMVYGTTMVSPVPPPQQATAFAPKFVASPQFPGQQQQFQAPPFGEQMHYAGAGPGVYSAGPYAGPPPPPQFPPQVGQYAGQYVPGVSPNFVSPVQQIQSVPAMAPPPPQMHAYGMPQGQPAAAGQALYGVPAQYALTQPPPQFAGAAPFYPPQRQYVGAQSAQYIAQQQPSVQYVPAQQAPPQPPVYAPM